jgi:hypothetical protein
MKLAYYKILANIDRNQNQAIAAAIESMDGRGANTIGIKM